MFRAGSSSIGAGERPPEGSRRGGRSWARAGVALLLLGAGACHPAPVIYPPLRPATPAAGDPPATAAGPEAGPGTAPSAPSTATGDPPASARASTPPPAAPGEASAAPVNRQEDDDHLIASVRRAAAGTIAPDDVVAMVGKKPTVNTRTGLSIAVLRRVTLVPDDAHAGERLDLASAEAVIYWARPVDSLDPHFVGIQFRKDGTRSLFFAVLLPP